MEAALHYPQFASSARKSVIPTMQSPSRSAGHDGRHGSGHGPHADSIARKSTIPTVQSPSRSPAIADGGAVIDVYPEKALPVFPELEFNGKPFQKIQETRLIPPFTGDVERQIFYERYVAAQAYVRANGLDRIVVLDDGRIVEEGSHMELLAAEGLYARLWARQSGGFIDREAAE